MKQKECQASYCKQGKDGKRAMSKESRRFCVINKRWKEIPNACVPTERVTTLNVQHYEAHCAEVTRSKRGLIVIAFSICISINKAQRSQGELMWFQYTCLKGVSHHTLCWYQPVLSQCVFIINMYYVLSGECHILSNSVRFLLYGCRVFTRTQIMQDPLETTAHWKLKPPPQNSSWARRQACQALDLYVLKPRCYQNLGSGSLLVHAPVTSAKSSQMFVRYHHLCQTASYSSHLSLLLKVNTVFGIQTIKHSLNLIQTILITLQWNT